MPARPDIHLERVYDDIDRDSAGHRVLVDRLWPRGIARADAAFDEWLKAVAPSTELRRWYDHDVARFEAFARRYQAELQRPPASEAVRQLLERASVETVTLLTATRDIEHSGARVLLEWLINHATSPPASSRPPVAARARLGRARRA